MVVVVVYADAQAWRYVGPFPSLEEGFEDDLTLPHYWKGKTLRAAVSEQLKRAPHFAVPVCYPSETLSLGIDDYRGRGRRGAVDDDNRTHH